MGPIIPPGAGRSAGAQLQAQPGAKCSRLAIFNWTETQSRVTVTHIPIIFTFTSGLTSAIAPQPLSHSPHTAEG
eukprot:scaffold23411_cov36-Phaeocystis_antarctica.AAC.2